MNRLVGLAKKGIDKIFVAQKKILNLKI